ncbi:MAG: NAD(P)H-dependent glycerol-3-phosphate dehydrogenase [Candidatus Omnitrophica bacterium]|nr:NAD(P)H-dependent glycerol-3-phosphate dehydrogenase [Candidatus Omnitrophota bacterium]
MSRISVIGDGGWGTALGIHLAGKGIDTLLWSVSPEYAERIRRKRENDKFLPGIKIPSSLDVTAETEVVRRRETALFAVPCEYLRSVAERFRGAEFDNVISATKGVENNTLKRPSEILEEYFPESRISVISGPSISYEVARQHPTTVVLAGKDGHMRELRDLLMNGRFRVYTSEDVTGVELGGALKNVIAIAAGISDGLGFGTNSKAAILTRGLAEITRLGVSMGADSGTFRGLSGLGDLATTCISSHSRNRWFGEQIGKGRGAEEVLEGTEMVVEGALTCRSAYELSMREKVDMPIIGSVYKVLYEGMSPQQEVEQLMNRDPKEEDYE